VAYYNRGIAWEKKSDLDKAIADYARAIEINSENSNYYYNRGNVFYKSAIMIAQLLISQKP